MARLEGGGENGGQDGGAGGKVWVEDGRVLKMGVRWGKIEGQEEGEVWGGDINGGEGERCMMSLCCGMVWRVRASAHDCSFTLLTPAPTVRCRSSHVLVHVCGGTLVAKLRPADLATLMAALGGLSGTEEVRGIRKVWSGCSIL